MTTVAELASQPHQEVAYLLAIEGWPIMWTNRADLAGSGAGSWIGEDHGPRVVADGLEIDGSVRLEIDLVDTGMPRDHGRKFTIIDRHNYIISYFEDEPGDAVYERLSPTDDPAPETLLGANGNDVSIHGKWIDGEAIGPAGERRQYPCIPGFNIGLDHPALDTAVDDQLRASVVQQAARHFEGRPFALYLLRKDPSTGTWPSWEDQYNSGVSLIYWGVVKNPPTVKAFEWSFEVEGPGSWLCRTLNTTRVSTWQPARPILELSDDEAKIAVAFYYMRNDAARQDCASSVYELTLTSGQTRAELAAEINGHLQTLATTAGPDTTFSTFYSGKVELTKDHFFIQVQKNNGSDPWGGIMRLRMHSKVWMYLGWQLMLEAQGRKMMWPLATQVEVEAEEGDVFSSWGLPDTPDPTKGYWSAIFRTLPLNEIWLTSFACDNGGAARYYKPLITGEGIAVLQPTLGASWNVGWGDGPYMDGQLARPPADIEIGGTPCDAAGFALFRGSYMTEVDGEVTTQYALGQISWVDDGGKVGLDTDDTAIVYAEKWLKNKQFGAPDWASPWAATDFEYMPVALLGYNTTQPDLAHAVLARLLLSSGTASWSGGTITAGSNAHPDAISAADDREVADLGLCIPAAMVDLQSFRDAAEALPGGLAGPLNWTRNLFVGPFDSYQFIESVLLPRNWAFSFRGGRYGLIARSAPLDVEAVEVAITQSDVAGEPTELPPSEDVRFDALLPIDLIEVSYGHNQFEADNSGVVTANIKALDPRSAMRRSNAKLEIDARTLLADGSWRPDFARLWGREAAAWFAEPWSIVRVKVMGPKAKDLWPGTIVSYTSPWPATRNGEYGMNTPRIGRVVSVDRDLETLATTVEILVEGKDPTSSNRRFAPLARLVDDHETVEERHDSASRKLYCYADAFGRGSDASDVTGFTMPAWWSGTGQALAYVWSSWDGRTWEKTAEFEVETVDPDEHSITYAAGTLSGTIWERRFTILTLAPHDDQDTGAWPQSLFGVVCGSDGKFGSGDTSGFPWVD
jgi:hypothetical protein